MSEITVTKDLIGEEDLAIGYGTYARSTSTGSSMSMTKIGAHTLFPEVFHVEQYGAVGDGTTDDYDAIQGAIEAALTAGGGTVVLGAKTYATTHDISLRTGVNLIGMGPSSVIKAKTSAVSIILDVVQSEGDVANIGGTSGNFTLDGNAVASFGLNVGYSTYRTFQNIVIQDVDQIGLRLVATEGCIFENIVISGCTGTYDYGSGIYVSEGAQNNTFINCRVSECEPYFIVLRDQGTSSLGYSAGPSNNTFLNCVCEHVNNTGTAMVYVASGVANQFINCRLIATAAPSSGYTVFKNTDDDRSIYGGGQQTIGTRISGGFIYGNTYTTAIYCTGLASVVHYLVADGIVFVQHDIGFSCDAYGRLLLGPSNQYSGISTHYTSGGGSESSSTLSYLGREVALIQREASTDPCFRVNRIGDAFYRFYVTADGDLYWGDGVGGGDAKLEKTTLIGGKYANAALVTNCPIALESTTAAIYAGSGDPTNNVVASRGSIFLNTAGGSGTAIYVKETGDNTSTGWVAK